MTKKPRQVRPVPRAETLHTPKLVDELAAGRFISDNNLQFPQEPRRGVSSCVTSSGVTPAPGDSVACLAGTHSGTRQARPGELIPVIPLVVVELDLTE